MKACGRCERENPDDGRFCSYCGLVLATGWRDAADLLRALGREWVFRHLAENDA